MPPTFCLCFVFTGINFWGMLHHAWDVRGLWRTHKCRGTSWYVRLNFRSSRREAFSKKGVLRNFAKFRGKHLCQSLFLIKLLFYQKRDRCFPVNFAKFLRTPFLTGHLRWLLLSLTILGLGSWNKISSCGYFHIWSSKKFII